MKLSILLLFTTLVFPIVIGATNVQDLSSPAARDSLSPQLVMDGNSVILSWLEPDQGGFLGRWLKPNQDHFRFRWSRLAEGNWTAPLTVAESTKTFANPADRPSILAVNQQTYFAHWLRRIHSDGPTYETIITRSDDGGSTWQEIGPIRKDRRPDSKGSDGFLSFVREENGARAFWIDGRNDDGNETLMSLRTALVDHRIHSEAILDADICSCCLPSVAQTDKSTMIFYRGHSKQGIRDILYVRKNGTSWSKPKSIHNDNWKINGCPVNGPDADAKGESVVVSWFTAAANKPSVYAAISVNAGESFSAPIILNDDPAFSPRGNVQASLLPSGEAIVIWLARATKDDQLMLLSRKIDPRGKPSKAVVLWEFGPQQSADFPQMVIQGSDLILAWSDVTAEKNGTHRKVITVKKLDFYK